MPSRWGKLRLPHHRVFRSVCVGGGGKGGLEGKDYLGGFFFLLRFIESIIISFEGPQSEKKRGELVDLGGFFS